MSQALQVITLLAELALALSGECHLRPTHDARRGPTASAISREHEEN